MESQDHFIGQVFNPNPAQGLLVAHQLHWLPYVPQEHRSKKVDMLMENGNWDFWHVKFQECKHQTVILLGCPRRLVTIVSKLVDFTYLRDVSNLPIKGVISQFTKYHGHPSSAMLSWCNKKVSIESLSFCLAKHVWKLLPYMFKSPNLVWLGRWYINIPSVFFSIIPHSLLFGTAGNYHAKKI